MALLAKKQPEEAVAVFQQAVSYWPEVPEFRYNLGNALRDAGHLDEAIAAFREAIHLRPDLREPYENLGNVFQAKEDFQQAVETYRKAISISPGAVGLHYNLGGALQQLDQYDQAIDAYRTAIAVEPGFSAAYNNLGGALLASGRVDEAIAAFRQTVAIEPQFASGHANLGMALLLKGDFDAGWPEYDWRTRAPDFAEFGRVDLIKPRWDGEDLENRTLLIHTEQGFGDAFQFIRLLPQVALRCGQRGKIILQCDPELLRLFKNLPGVHAVLTRQDRTPEFDVHCPLLSLPMILKVTLANIPTGVPYLHADAELSSQWRQRLPSDRLKVGVVWSGRKNPNPRRTVPLKELLPLAKVPGVALVNLQFGDAAKEAQSFPNLAMLDLSQEIHDFADAAAVIANLDLLITIDTAAAHLAGAVGARTWLLLPFAPDWRWMLKRTDSPWYPTMRLFRQPRPRDWATPIQQVLQELQCLN
jgi:tetratricopeptide (TPR) repeat protein